MIPTPKPRGTPAFSRVKGIRRVMKVYGPVDPKEHEKRVRVMVDHPWPYIRKPHSGLKTSVKDTLS